jgi:AcrR family transcriptional regulator
MLETPREAPDTKDRILDAAERLFAGAGVGATSLRTVTAEAGVNVAAIHYHFGSKHELLRAVFVRRVAPINQERLKRLDALEAASEPPTLEDILEALVSPSIEFAQAHPELSELAGLLYSEPIQEARALAHEVFFALMRRFRSALERVLPHLEGDEIEVRFAFLVGAMVHVLSRRAPLPLEPAEMRDDLLRFLAAGLRAPAPSRAPRRDTS